jgi:hypothetical protein
MKTLMVLLVCVASLSACKKKERWGVGCEKAKELVAPWPDLGLPAEKGRVCEADAKRAEFRFLSGSKDDHYKAFEDKLVSLGYVKGRCMSDSCVYESKDGKRIQLHGMSAKSWVTVVVRDNTREEKEKPAANP